MTWTEPVIEEVARLVSLRTGLTFDNRQDSVELGIRRAMARARMADPARYLDCLASDDRALDDLVGELTIGETYFFREPDQFEIIRRQMLPEILKRRGPDHIIRAWSTACASGEEAYSLAILFQEEGLGDRTQVLATDISQQGLAKARQGFYSDWSLRGTHGKTALPYLNRSGSSYRLNDTLRKRVRFEPLNLALNVYPSFTNGIWGMDLILCRNVLIYFAPDTVKTVASRLFQSLADGGWLITGAADPPLWDSADFEVVATEAGIFYRRPTGRVASGEWWRAEERKEGRKGEGEQERPEEHAKHYLTSAEEDNELPPALSSDNPTAAPSFETAAPASLDPPQPPLEEVRAQANVDAHQAERLCARKLVDFPLSPELNYLHAILLLSVGREAEAIQAVRRVIYLDRSLAVAHFTLASLLRRHGDVAGAQRAYRNARDLCAARPAEDTLPLADGESAGRLAEAAGVELALLEEGAP